MITEKEVDEAVQGRESYWQNTFYKLYEENKENTFLTIDNLIEMTTETLQENKNKTHTSNTAQEIKNLVEDLDDVTITGTIQNISETLTFKNKKDTTFQLKKICLQDENGDEIKINVWNKDIDDLPTSFNNGWYGTIKGLRTSMGYQDQLEASWQQKTSVTTLGQKEVHQTYQTSIKELQADNTYLIVATLVFMGEPITVGLKQTSLRQCIFMDKHDTLFRVNYWRNTYEHIDEYTPGDILTFKVNVNEYKDDIQYNYDSDWRIEKIGTSNPPKINYISYSEFMEEEPDTKCNIQGIVSRIYNPHPYNKGNIWNYELMLGEDETITYTTFNNIGDILDINVGDKLCIYNAVISYDEYNWCNKAIYGWDTLVNINDNGNSTPVPMDTVCGIRGLNDLMDIADSDEYFDIQCLVLRKQYPMTYQRSDDTAGTLCRYTIADTTSISNMICWGDNHNNLKYNDYVTLYNVRATEDFDTGSIEVHMDSKTRIVPCTNDVNQIYQRHFPLEYTLTDDLLGENITLTGNLGNIFELITYPRCPNCGRKVSETLTGTHCEHCDKDILKPYELYRIDLTLVTEQGITIPCRLWGDCAHSLVDDYINKEYLVTEQNDAIRTQLQEKQLIFYGTVDYDDNDDLKYLKVLGCDIDETSTKSCESE